MSDPLRACLTLLAVGFCSADADRARPGPDPRKLEISERLEAGGAAALAVSADGQRLVVCASSGVRMFKRDAGRWKAASAVAFAAPSAVVAAAFGSEPVWLRADGAAASATGQELFRIEGGAFRAAMSPARTIAVTPQGVAVVGKGGKLLRKIECDGAGPVAPAGEDVLVGTADGRLRLWNAAGREVSSARVSEGSIVALATTRASGLAALATARKEMKLVALADLKAVWTTALAAIPSVLALSPDGRSLWFGESGELKVLDIRSKKIVRTFRLPAAPTSVAFSPREAAVFVACGDGHVRVLSERVKEPLTEPAAPRRAGFLGVTLEEGEHGARITSIVDGTAARAAGLLENDELLEVDGAVTKTFDDVKAVIGSKFEGDAVDLRVRRGERQFLLRVQIGGRE